MDAPKLFDALKVAPVDAGDRLEKSVSLNFPGQVFEISCNLSKQVANFGSCTLKVYSSGWTVIDKAKKSFLLGLNGSADAWMGAEKFIAADPTTEDIYRSLDNKLRISSKIDQYGTPVSFTIEYRN